MSMIDVSTRDRLLELVYSCSGYTIGGLCDTVSEETGLPFDCAYAALNNLLVDGVLQVRSDKTVGILKNPAATVTLFVELERRELNSNNELTGRIRIDDTTFAFVCKTSPQGWKLDPDQCGPTLLNLGALHKTITHVINHGAPAPRRVYAVPPYPFDLGKRSS